MVVLMKKLVIILLISWRTRFNFEIIEGLLAYDALDMCDEPEKMNVLTKLSKHLPSRKKNCFNHSLDQGFPTFSRLRTTK